MMMCAIALVLGGALALSMGPVVACPDGEHDARRHAQPSAQPPVYLTPPSRPLVWGDVNIIHTTDSHGWLLGHKKTPFPEPNYRCVMSCQPALRVRRATANAYLFSGDFGDFASFVAHMKKIAEVCELVRLRGAVANACVAWSRRRMSTCCWQIPGTFMMVTDAGSFFPSPRADYIRHWPYGWVPTGRC